MATTTVKLVLVGPRSGKSVVLNAYEFVNGVCVLQGDPAAVAGAVHYLSRCYNAHPEGSQEHQKALVDWEKAQQEASGGQRNPQSSADSDASAEVRGSGQPDGGGAPPEGADEQPNDADPEAGAAGGVPGGNGHPDARVPPEVPDEFSARVKEAVGRLDHTNDEHWTDEGLPRVSAVSEILGENVSRQQLGVVCPDLVRKES